MNNDSTHFVTPRDRDLLRVLSWCPLTAEQLLKVSAIFSRPFTNYRYLQRRMQVLGSGGWVRQWPYATASRGALSYYRLSPLGFRLLNGPDVPFPSKAAFNPVSPALQAHTRALADFIVHAAVVAHRSNVTFTDFQPENSLQLRLDDETMKPDCAFRLVTAEGESYQFLVELDAGSEPVVSTKERESVEAKIAFYDRYRDASPQPFRLVIVTVHDSRRQTHIIQAAERALPNRQRTLVYVGNLRAFLNEFSVRSRCFTDHRGLRHSLVPHYLLSPYARTDTPFEHVPNPLAPVTSVG